MAQQHAVRSAAAGVAVGATLAWVLASVAQAPAQVGERTLGSSASFAGPGQTIAFATDPQRADQAPLLFIIDTQTRTFSVYRVDAQKGGKTKLLSVRQYGWDQQLSQYNNEPPEVRDIEQMLRQQ